MSDWIRLEKGKFYVNGMSLIVLDSLRWPCGGGRVLRSLDSGGYIFANYAMGIDDSLPVIEREISYAGVCKKIYGLLGSREEKKRAEHARLLKLHNVLDDRKNLRFGSCGYFYETAEMKPEMRKFERIESTPDPVRRRHD